MDLQRSSISSSWNYGAVCTFLKSISWKHEKSILKNHVINLPDAGEEMKPPSLHSLQDLLSRYCILKLHQDLPIYNAQLKQINKKKKVDQRIWKFSYTPYMCVCVWERERDRVRGRTSGHTWMLHPTAHPVNSSAVPYPLTSYSSAGPLSSKGQ